MVLSIILLIVDCFLLAVLTFSYVVCNELAIKPLGVIKRNLLVNMTKRKALGNPSDDSIEDDNKNMKKFEHIIRKFRFKYSLFILIIVIATIVMICYSHIDLSAILVAIGATVILIYLLSRLVVLSNEVKDFSMGPIKKLLKLDDKFMNVLKEEGHDNKEE
ncbi:MAG: hypothetical protein MJ245_05510 [Clostridia bacterium]|nr:hypothetical protein [Clostridia bacterium]